MQDSAPSQGDKTTQHCL